MPDDTRRGRASATVARPLESQVVLITGGARGIGRTIAGAAARAGADIAVTARSLAGLEPVVADVRGTGARALALSVDLRDRASIVPAIEEAMRVYGRIDVLVCNAGMAGPSSSVLDISDAEWDETIDVNLTGTFLVARETARYMVQSQRGSIVLIGSMTGKRPLLNRAPYAASKLALVGLCRTMAWDLGPTGVRVNLVSPGFVDGTRLDWVVETQAAAKLRAPESIRHEMVSTSPLLRTTKPADVAQAVLFLASEAASGITGEDLNVSSGLVMYG